MKKQGYIIGLWYSGYSIIIPCAIAIICFYLHSKDEYNIFCLENMNSALNGVITSESILLSLYGVIVTLLANSSSNSKAIKTFLRWADNKELTRVLTGCVLFSVFSIAVSVAMFFIRPQKCFLFFEIWIWLFVAVLCRTYRIISLVVKLFFLDDSMENAKDNDNLEDQIERFYEKHKSK